MKHTKGPWIVRYGSDTGYPRSIEAPNDKGKPGAVWNIVRWNGIGFPSSETGQANARLIAAAPELLEACKALYNAKGNPSRLEKALIKAEAAIDKAEGRE